MRYSIPLVATIPMRFPFRGKCIAIVDTGAAAEVNVTLFRSEQDSDAMGDVGRYFSAYWPESQFTGAEFTAAGNCTIEIIVANYRVEPLDGANLTVTLGGQPVQVREDVASAGVDNAAVAVTDVITAILAADPLRKSIRFQNVGVDPVAIGFAALTWATRSVVLNPGDVFIEDRGANLAWSGITSAAGLTASVTAQEILA